jgi:hypothetical protein
VSLGKFGGVDAVVRFPINVLASAHPATNIKSFPELTFARLRPRNALVVVRDVHNLRISGRNLRPCVPTGSIRIVIDRKVCPPGLHLLIKNTISCSFGAPQVVQLTRVFDQTSLVSILMLRELENIHISRGAIVVLIGLLVYRARVQRCCVGVIGCHEIVSGRSLGCVVVSVEVSVTLSIESSTSEVIPPFRVLIFRHVVTYHGHIHHYEVRSIILTKARHRRNSSGSVGHRSERLF